MKNKVFYYKNRISLCVVGLLYLLCAGLVCAALFSYSPEDPSFTIATHDKPQNILGIAGSYSSDLLLQIFGFASIMFIVFPFAWGMQKIIDKEVNYFWLRFIFALSSVIILSTILVKYNGEIVGSYNIPSFGGAVGAISRHYVINLRTDYLLLGQISALIISLYIALNIDAMSIYRFLRHISLFCCYVCKKVLKILWSVITTIWFLFNQNSDSKDTNDCKDENYKSTDKNKLPKFSFINKHKKHSAEKKNSFTQTSRKNPRDEQFLLPSEKLLNNVKQQKSNVSSPKEFQEKAKELLQVLLDFGVNGKIINCFPGPVVTLYEFQPAAGIKSSKVIGLSDDIARTMRAISTRIAIIPGKNSLGIELPNAVREIVYLRENVESNEYRNSLSCKLPLILGKDIAGRDVVADLAKMPHLLVAGTTGSGKSVAINTMILSLLYRYTPEECKFVMIDPKMLELSVYQGIPHLLSPVVTEPGKAVIALKWTVKEMENRYKLMSHLNVRNLEGYNDKIDAAIKSGEELSKTIQTGFDAETGKPIYEKVEIEKKKLPLIVVIVDEMADLMIVAGKEIESSIQRLAQMARAAGIHIIMATQRPSVDVITGVIKANFPTRISFQVTSKIDSRTILGEMGAEQLLGKGDMLYMSGGNKIKRVHAPFVADSEVESVVAFLKQQGEPIYQTDITSDSQLSGAAGMEEKDELYNQAVDLVIREQKASTSFLQRYFKIGYNRAATIIEQMETYNVISPANHVGRREILVNK